MQIPQEVVNRIAVKLRQLHNQPLSWEDYAGIIIPLAQLPITSATEPECKRFDDVWHACTSDKHWECTYVALNDLFSRRNSQPQVDALVETTYKQAEPGSYPLAVCQTCGSFVAGDCKELHTEWHKKIAQLVQK